MKSQNNFDVIILGGGMVGLSIAFQLIKKNITKNICIIDKEKKLGLHSSGRNSGVLHAGLYYEPNSLKAKVCVNGSKRLKEWIIERKLTLNNCGKVIVPQDIYLDSQLDLLKDRGTANGARVEMWDEKTLKEFIPSARTSISPVLIFLLIDSSGLFLTTPLTWRTVSVLSVSAVLKRSTP